MAAMQQTLPKQKKKKAINLHNFGIGLSISLLSQPFEVMRTSSITRIGKTNGGHFLGTFSVIKQIYKLEGMKGFYRGGLVGVGKSTIGAGVFFNMIEYSRALTQGLREYASNGAVNFLDACIARIVNTTVVMPFNVLKTRFEVVGNRQYKSILDGVTGTYRTQGTKGFFKGFLPTLIRDVPFSGIEYATYRFIMESYSKYLRVEGNSYDNSFLVWMAGGSAATFAVLLTYPFDNIRVRLQTNDLAGKPNVGMKAMMSEVYRNEGIGGFYVGYLPRLMKKGFACSLAWMFYERFRDKSSQ